MMGRHNTIWIIDDWQSCQTAEHLWGLTYKQYTVVPLYTESMLVAHLESTQQAPAIILLGHLPGKHNQLRLLHALKAHDGTSLTPIIVLTKAADTAYLREAYALRANACVEKPSSPEEYIPLITLTCDYWFNCCTLPAHITASI
ncbi:hypothetical protein GCM10023189_15240 [Nibrella saemangeumensis]|uniref:Response regulator n=1 Tax=Nibrella saemangeumensis TaxID=1084526 RepID=A0ABP8MNA1_9BACT